MSSTFSLPALGMLAIAAVSATATALAYAGQGSLDDLAVPQALQPTGHASTAVNTDGASRDTDRHNRRGRDDGHDGPTHQAAQRGMQALPISAGPGEPAHGWRYYTDASGDRAVVISPQGEYFLSRGEGLHLVAVTQSVR